MQKGFTSVTVLIGIVVVVLAIGGFFYLNQNNGTKVEKTTSPYSQTSPLPQTSNQPTAVSDWQTYSNAKFNYSVKLPANYTALDAEFNPVADTTNQYDISFLKYSADQAKQYKDQSREKAFYDSLTVLIQGNDTCSTIDPANTVKKGKVMIGSIEGTEWIGNSPSFGDPSYGDVVIRAYTNSRCYKIYFLRDPQNLQQSENLLNQILPTFKFTE